MGTDTRTQWTTTTPYSQKEHPGALKIVSQTIDALLKNVTSGDDVTIINIPAKALVTNVWYELITAEGGALTADIGDDGSATRWFSNADLNAAAGTMAASSTSPYIYTAANTIDVHFDGAADACKLVVHVAYLPSD